MDTPEELRSRAAMCRTLAPGMSTAAGRAELLKIAAEYEARADAIERGESGSDYRPIIGTGPASA